MNPKVRESSKEPLPLSFHNFTKLVHSVPWLCLLALPVSFNIYAPSRFWGILSEIFTFEMLSMVSSAPSFDSLNERFMTPRDGILALKVRMSQNIVGQEHILERLLIGLLGNGNLLVEGLPGLAKNLVVKSLI